MEYALSVLGYSLLLFAGMIGCGEAGRRLALRRAARDPEGARQGIGVIDGAVFGLLGLLVAFTFSGAVSRFDARRALVVEEVNAIDTAYLRLDVLPGESQPALRDSFRRYVDSRIKLYRDYSSVNAAQGEIESNKRLQSEIWRQAVAASQGSQPATMLLIPALNQMFDITTSRTITVSVHPPAIIFIMLFGVSLIASMLAGFGMARAASRNWFHIVIFSSVMVFAFYVILDIEYPRLGIIRLTAIDQALVDLRASMN